MLLLNECRMGVSPVNTRLNVLLFNSKSYSVVPSDTTDLSCMDATRTFERFVTPVTEHSAAVLAFLLHVLCLFAHRKKLHSSSTLVVPSSPLRSQCISNSTVAAAYLDSLQIGLVVILFCSIREHPYSTRTTH